MQDSLKKIMRFLLLLLLITLSQQQCTINPNQYGVWNRPRNFQSKPIYGLSCFGTQCPASCISSQVCLRTGGNIYGSNCYICSSGQTFVNGYCQPGNQGIISQSQSNTNSQCSITQIWNGNMCVCKSGYVGINGACYMICGQNAYILNNKCVCQPGYTFSSLSGSQTICISQNSQPSQTNSNNQISTVTSCGTNFINVNGNCVCPTGYGKINNLCLVCPANSFVNTLGNCQCINGFSLSSVTLLCNSNCFPNSKPNSIGQCVCNDGFYNQGNSCIPFGNCQNGFIYNGQTCVCPQGTYLRTASNQCVACTGAGQAVQGSNCICASTFYPTANGCAQCTANSVFNVAVQQCVCLSGFTLNGGLCLSICPTNARWNPQTSSCVCNSPGFMVINNNCVPCPSNSYWTGITCQCQSGLTLTNGICISNCSSNAYWNGNSCLCNTGFYLISGVCSVCKPNTYYSPGDQSCLCNPGFYGNSQVCYPCDSSCGTCWGPANTQCSACRSGGSFNTFGGCTYSCPAGQFLNPPSNTCSNCIANCILCYTSVSCATCANGYTINTVSSGTSILISCVLSTPTGSTSTLSLRSFVIGNNVVYQGIALSTIPNVILATGCTICNSLLTVNVVSTFTSVQTTIQYITNSQYWFLITFSFTGVSFIPSFQFTVQINPLYAAYFTSADMSQKITSTINPQTTFGSTGVGSQSIAISQIFP